MQVNKKIYFLIVKLSITDRESIKLFINAAS